MTKHRKLSVGDKIEYLKILEFTGVKQKGTKRLNFCMCECLKCGKTIEIPVYYVGRVYRSCGCLQDESRRKDIEPDTIFTRLKVIERTDKKKHNSYMYRCICVCGNEVLVKSDLLRNGDVKSCGCLHDELFQKSSKAIREYIFVHDTNINKIKEIRLANNNTSGTVGVGWHKKLGKWQTRIDFQKKTYYLGYYKDKNDAIKARKAAEKEIYGNFLEWYAKNYPDKWNKINKNNKEQI